MCRAFSAAYVEDQVTTCSSRGGSSREIYKVTLAAEPLAQWNLNASYRVQLPSTSRLFLAGKVVFAVVHRLLDDVLLRKVREISLGHQRVHVAGW